VARADTNGDEGVWQAPLTWGLVSQIASLFSKLLPGAISQQKAAVFAPKPLFRAVSFQCAAPSSSFNVSANSRNNAVLSCRRRPVS
jgi:hypothetical protein